MEALRSYYEISPFFFTVTASASFLYITMNLFLIFGGGTDDLDASIHSDFAFKFFSTQTILAFFMGFGWAGITSSIKWSLPILTSLMIAVVFGLLLMSFSAFLLYHVRRLNHVSSINIYSSLGSKGTVYSAIPTSTEGEGKIQVEVSGSLKIISAVSTDEAIDSFTEIEVIGVKNKDTLIVRKLNKDTSSNGESA